MNEERLNSLLDSQIDLGMMLHVTKVQLDKLIEKVRELSEQVASMRVECPSCPSCAAKKKEKI
jgi:hypothetical protein